MPIHNRNLYSIARLAKERLKRNNYIMTPSPKSLDNSEIMSSYISSHKKQPVLPQRHNSAFSKASDDFYLKVCHIIECGTSINPISELIDRDVFTTLGTEDKQHYISSLSAKYKKSRDRYYREHPMSLIL